MAAKQGFTAHISQASEDARRAVLSRAPSAIKSHSWLSNLNTTCTIKSAPPRTPEAMTLLSVKSGWLVKRNEQHIWQRRWCCVVPHTMLYYFEAEPAGEDFEEGEPETTEGFSGGGIYRSQAIVVENQDVLNSAVRDGYNYKNRNNETPLRGENGDRPSSPMSMEKKMTAAPVRGPMTNSGNLSPVGIIDLECYTCINRSSVHDCVFELTGDAITNPDLRSFYFQAADVEDCELWTNALISDRHSALRDEREAYRQVCDSFQLQLQNMSDMIDEADGKTAETERKLYNVRSKAQKFKSEIASIVREALEQKSWGSTNENENILEMTRNDLLDKLDEILALEASNKNVGSPVQVLADYLATVVGSHTELAEQLSRTKQQLNQSADVDNETVSDLKLQLQRLEAEKEEEKARYEGKIAGLEAQLNESQTACEELENQAQTQRMEFTMFQSQAKSKLQELSSHKKILKKEVIELRKKKEQVESERDAAMHVTDSHRMHAESAKEKNEVLQKYIENMENQVRVQQNMMEMISLSGMSQSGMSQGSGIQNGSVVGRIIGAPDDNSFSSFGNMIQQRMRDASPNKLPPRSRLPPGQPPVSTISKKDMTAPLPLSSPKKIRKFGADSFDTDDEYMVENRKTSRGVLDEEINANTEGLTHEKRLERYHQAISDSEKVINRANHIISKNDRHLQNRDVARDVDDLPAEDDDNKTNVSELTEDRTQRHFDTTTSRQIYYTRSDTTGENIIHDGRGFTKGPDGRDIPVKYQKEPTPQRKNEYPPRFIMGASTESQSNNETVQTKTNDDTTKSVITETSASTRTKLSVAQKARIAADRAANSVDVSSVGDPSLALSEPSESKQVKKVPPPSTPTRSQSPSVFSAIGKRVVTAFDNSKLAVKVPESPTDGAKNAPKEIEEPKLTLAQRQKIQRQRQLRVLKEEGLIKGSSEED